jgi:hypothetical protein
VQLTVSAVPPDTRQMPTIKIERKPIAVRGPDPPPVAAPATPPTSSPNLIEMGVSAMTAAARWIAAGSPMRTPEQSAECQAICQSCEHWKAPKRRGKGKCSHCGCFLASKIRMATESCPLGKWLATITPPEPDS